MSRKTSIAALGLVLVMVAAGAGLFGYHRVTERQFQAALAEARAAVTGGRPSTALERLSALAAQRPNEGEIHYLLGLCQMMRGKADLAEAAWRQIPESDVLHTGLAALYWADLDRERGRLTDAENRLSAALAAPGSQRPQVRWSFVQLLVLEGRKHEALRLFADGLGEHPDPVEGLRVLYKLETDPFPLEAARDYFASAAKLAPEDDRVWLGRANLAVRSGDISTAESLLKSCLERRPNDRPSWEMLLECGVQSDRPDLVLKTLQQLPAETRDELQNTELRVWVAKFVGDRAAERRALERLPASARVFERLAELEIENGHPERAAAHRAKRAKNEQSLVNYLRRIGSTETASDPVEMARLSKEAGRWLDAEFWAARAGEGAEVRKADEKASSTGRTLADVLPDVVAALESSRKAGQTAGGIPVSRPQFADDAEQAGLKFVHESGTGSSRLIPPLSFSGGVALLDFDRDGYLDLYAVQSARFPGGPESTDDGDRLFRNLGDGRFEDVTRRAGLEEARGYGHGVAVGDVDNDGYPDLFVTRWRAYALYRNRGNGTYEDVTGSWGLSGNRDWPTSAAFADLDSDGDLDLYVCHYIAWDEKDNRACVDPADPTRFNCNPRDFPSLPDHLFRNDGGRFVDVTKEAGITDPNGRGLGVVAADFDGDNKVDLFIANDMSANLLFINQGNLRFEERALEAGVAANASGGYQAGMGVACGDLDGDGRLDLAVTNFYGESTSYFQNLGNGLFADRTSASGLLAPSRPLLGFGAAFFDSDNDGQLDLLTVNGHIHDGRPLYPWRMPFQLLQGGPPGKLVEVSSDAGPPFRVPHISRALAVGDVDNDGRIDAVIQNQDEPLVYLHNRSKASHFIAFELEGTASNRDGVGATVTIVLPDGKRRILQRTGGGSYQSSSSPILQIGLGEAPMVSNVEVLWPSGRIDRFKELGSNRRYRLREGSPEAQPLTDGPLQPRQVPESDTTVPKR